MANIELELKAADKRLTGLEKTVDSMARDMRQLNAAATEKRMDTIEKRLVTIEALVKALAASSKAGGNVDSTNEIKKMIIESENKLYREMNADPRTTNVKETTANVARLTKEAELLAVTLKTVTAKHEKHATDEKARIDKHNADQKAEILEMNKQLIAQGKQLTQTMALEARLKAVETMTNVALAAATKRT